MVEDSAASDEYDAEDESSDYSEPEKRFNEALYDSNDTKTKASRNSADIKLCKSIIA